MTRCVCPTPLLGAYAVCRRCGGEYQKKHSKHCDCATCSGMTPKQVEQYEAAMERLCAAGLRLG